MMKLRNTIRFAALFMAVAAAVLFLLDQTEVNAQEERIIRIWGRAAPQIEPPTLLISKGATVIWFNNAKDEVMILFEEGKKCDDVTDAGSLFSMNAANCYVTTWLSFGATSSLRFNEAGTYDYAVEYAGRKQRDSGKIIVE